MDRIIHRCLTCSRIQCNLIFFAVYRKNKFIIYARFHFKRPVVCPEKFASGKGGIDIPARIPDIAFRFFHFIVGARYKQRIIGAACRIDADFRIQSADLRSDHKSLIIVLRFIAVDTGFQFHMIERKKPVQFLAHIVSRIIPFLNFQGNGRTAPVWRHEQFVVGRIDIKITVLQIIVCRGKHTATGQHGRFLRNRSIPDIIVKNGCINIFSFVLVIHLKHISL